MDGIFFGKTDGVRFAEGMEVGEEGVDERGGGGAAEEESAFGVFDGEGEGAGVGAGGASGFGFAVVGGGLVGGRGGGEWRRTFLVAL